MDDERDKLPEVLSLDQAAKFLQIGKRTVSKLVRTDKLPCKLVTNKYRFLKKDLEKWLRGELS